MEIRKEQVEYLKSSSFSGRYAGTGTDFKLYFDTVEELRDKIDAIILAKNYLQSRLNEDVIDAEEVVELEVKEKKSLKADLHPAKEVENSFEGVDLE